MNLLLTIIISLVFSLIAFLMLRKEKIDLKYKIILITIIFIGSFVRLYRIDSYPVGLNQDEASIGYEAISIFKYGIDRFGMSYPVHLISWGSGQNALYAYLIMPLIKIITNDILLIRLPMALFGSLTLLFILYFIKKNCLNKEGIIVLLLFAIMPWHIMKSRWGLESNIFPDLVLYGLLFLYFGIKNKKNGFYILAAIIFGLSTYAYGTSYLYIPLLLLITYGYLVKRKKITIIEGMTYFFVTGVVALPMIIFVVVNYFDLNTVKIFNITIPKLYFNRFTEITSVNGNFFINCISNLFNSLRILITSNDYEALNVIPYYGMFYIFSLPFLIYGLIIYFKQYKKNECLNIAFIALVTGVLVSMFVEPKINRLNFLWFPVYIFIVLGVISLKNKYLKIMVVSLYCSSFVTFNYYYYGNYQKSLSIVNNVGLKEALTSINYEKSVYVTDTINQPYIFWLYHNKIPPQDYIDNRYIAYEKVMFQRIPNVGRVYFYLPNTSKLQSDKVYVIPATDKNRYIASGCKVNKYDNFIILDC